MKLRLVALVALLCVCTTVSAKKPAPLPTPLAPQLPVEVILNQHEMGVDVPATAAQVGMQFGLLGALIGAAIQQQQVSNAEERVAEIRNLLVDYRFNERVEARLRERLPSEGISPEPQFTFMPSPWDAQTAFAAHKQSQKGIMEIVPRYAISSDFEQIHVTLTVTINDRTVKSNGKVKDKPTTWRTYSWAIPMEKKAGSGATEDSKRWVAMGAPRLGALLDEAVDQVVDMFVYDFSADGRKEGLESVKHATASLQTHSYPGREVRHGDEWIWVRSGPVGMAGYHPINDGAVAALFDAPKPAEAAPAADASVPAAPAAPATAAPDAAPEAAPAANSAPVTGAGQR
jgi:hypothetical protein